jgi:hypothetical protein
VRTIQYGTLRQLWTALEEYPTAFPVQYLHVAHHDVREGGSPGVLKVALGLENSDADKAFTYARVGFARRIVLIVPAFLTTSSRRALSQPPERAAFFAKRGNSIRRRFHGSRFHATVPQVPRCLVAVH